jgi:hypothetical protein
LYKSPNPSAQFFRYSFSDWANTAHIPHPAAKITIAIETIMRDVGIGFGLFSATNNANTIRTASAAKKYQRGMAGPFGSEISGAAAAFGETKGFGFPADASVIGVETRAEVADATDVTAAAAGEATGALAVAVAVVLLAPCINVRTPAAICGWPFEFWLSPCGLVSDINAPRPRPIVGLDIAVNFAKFFIQRQF